jgi:hypothetical protein
MSARNGANKSLRNTNNSAPRVAAEGKGFYFGRLAGISISGKVGTSLSLRYSKTALLCNASGLIRLTQNYPTSCSHAVIGQLGTLKSNKNDPGLPVMSCNAGISTAQRTAEEDATVGVEARFRHAKLDGVLPTRRERCAPDRAAALRLRQPIASPPPCGMETAQCRAWDSSSPLLRLPSAARSPDALL